MQLSDFNVDFAVINSLSTNKFASNSLQICFKIVSKDRFKIVSNSLLNSLSFIICFVKFTSILFRKLFTPFNSFQICFRSELICLKMKWNFMTIPRKALKSVRWKLTIVGTEFDFQGSLKGWCTLLY